MSTRANILALTDVIQSVWGLELQELDLGKSSVLIRVLQTLRILKSELIAEREKRLGVVKGGEG